MVLSRLQPTWWHRVEGWYLAYALLGISTAGVAPMVLPLVVSRSGSPADVGLVMAAISLGGLTAPLWGGLAEHYRWHRGLLVGGLCVIAFAFMAFASVSSVPLWLGLAVIQGSGVAGATTVANLFVVEVHPQEEWDERIGWLQTFYGSGQVAGMLLAAGIIQASLEAGVWMAAGITALAVVLGWRTTRTPVAAVSPKPVVIHPVRHGDLARRCPQQLYHHLTPDLVRQLRRVLQGPFRHFLLLWLCTLLGSSAFFALYPVLMREVFGITASLSAAAFAVAAGLRLMVYVPAGYWSHRVGPTRVLRTAIGVRLCAMVVLLSLGLGSVGAPSWLVLPTVILIALSWALLSVSSTALAVRLSPVNEGEGIGMLNAVTALADMLGARLGGWCAARWGYNAATGVAVVGLAVGFALALVLQPDPGESLGCHAGQG